MADILIKEITGKELKNFVKYPPFLSPCRQWHRRNGWTRRQG